MDLKKFTKFAHPLTLLELISKDLEELGPVKFMDGAGERSQKAKELLFAFFFVMGLKKLTRADLWLTQDVGDTFPDFNLISFSKNEPHLMFFCFELVTIPDRCETFEDAFTIVKEKFKKGYPEKFNLLIFINNIKSKTWANELLNKIENYNPFQEVWVVYPLYKAETEISITVINRLRPLPSKGTAVSFDDPDLSKQQELPDFVEQTEIDGEKCLKFKDDFLLELKKRTLRNKLRKD